MGQTIPVGPWPDHQRLRCAQTTTRCPRTPTLGVTNPAWPFLIKGDFLDTSRAQGTHLISTEERARLRIAEMTQSIFQVGVDLNLPKARREKEVALPQARRPVAGREVGLSAGMQGPSRVKGAESVEAPGDR